MSNTCANPATDAWPVDYHMRECPRRPVTSCGTHIGDAFVAVCRDSAGTTDLARGLPCANRPSVRQPDPHLPKQRRSHRPYAHVRMGTPGARWGGMQGRSSSSTTHARVNSSSSRSQMLGSPIHGSTTLARPTSRVQSTSTASLVTIHDVPYPRGVPTASEDSRVPLSNGRRAARRPSSRAATACDLRPRTGLSSSPPPRLTT